MLSQFLKLYLKWGEKIYYRGSKITPPPCCLWAIGLRSIESWFNSPANEFILLIQFPCLWVHPLILTIIYKRSSQPEHCTLQLHTLYKAVVLSQILAAQFDLYTTERIYIGSKCITQYIHYNWLNSSTPTENIIVRDFSFNWHLSWHDRCYNFQISYSILITKTRLIHRMLEMVLTREGKQRI